VRRAPLPGEKRDMTAMQGTATRSASGSGRRSFCRAIAVGLAGGLVARAAGAAPPRLKIGCTGLIWGATPRTPENLATAVADMASLGYHCFETWGSVMQALDEKGGLGDLLAKHPIPFRSAFMGVNVHDPSKLKESLAQVIAWGKVTRKYGGTFAVVNAGGVDRKSFDFKAARAHIVSGLNEHGKALQDLGLQAGLHQHTGSAVDTRDEVYAVMEAVDSRYMKFAPDVGQLQKAGADAAAVVQDFLPIVVHMHLKDYSGGEHFLGYCPLGQGKVDLRKILQAVNDAHPDANVMVELDGSNNAPYTPRQTAEISKAFLVKDGYAFRS
jgi:inosose dehydratase